MQCWDLLLQQPTHCPETLLTQILQRAVHALFDFEPRELNEIYHKRKDFA